MSTYPLTRIVLAPGKALVTSGPHFHVLNADNGELVHSTTRLDDDTREKLRKAGPARCVAVDSTFTHAAVVGDDKKLKIWKVADALELVNERELPKKPTELCFTRDGQTIVISDKFGDVFSYPLHPPSSPPPTPALSGASKRGSLTSHENPSNGTLVLGHASLLTTFLLTPDEQYIVTADRDEHIRVSWYPQGYAIERYCLGHEKFVSAVHIPSFRPSTLISGGGDPMLKVWDWMSGKRLADIPVLEVVEPYIKVKAPKRRRAWNDGEGAEGEEAEAQPKAKGKGRRNKGRGKGKQQANEENRQESADVEPQPTPAQEDVSMAAEQEPNEDTTAVPDEVLVFVVHKISSVDRGESGQFIVFSVVGATSLFYTALPKENGTASSVHAVDFNAPVLDFAIHSDGAVWVLLDAEWNGASSQQVVRHLTWNGPTLSRDSREDNPLLSALNSKCLVPATSDELKALDLYGDLSSMPKNVDPEHDPLIRDTLEEAAAVDPVADGKQLTQRELGRLRKKKALLAKLQEQEKAKRELSECADADSEREVKRTRSESGHEHEHDGDACTNSVPEVEMDAS